MGALTGHPVRNIFRQLLLGSLGAKNSQPAWFSPCCHLQRNKKQLQLGSSWLGSVWSGLVHTPHTSHRAADTDRARQKVSHVSVILLTSCSTTADSFPFFLAPSLCLAQGCHILLAQAGSSYFLVPAKICAVSICASCSNGGWCWGIQKS